MEPLVSVIIPIYNVEQYLPQCLDSVINQTYKNIEIICVNDGSPDNCQHIVEEYKKRDSRITIINQENQGLSMARNNGFEIAKGDYVYFLDSDDWIDLQLIEKVVNIIENDNSDIIAFDITNVYDNGSTIPVRRIHTFYEKFKVRNFNFNDYKEIAYINCSAWSKVYKKKFLTDNNLKFPKDIRINEDIPFWFILLFCNPKISLLDQCPYYYRKREKSLSFQNPETINNVYKAFEYLKKSERYRNVTEADKLLALDYFCRISIYSYSTLSNYSLYPVFEDALKQYKNEYKKFKNYNLIQYKGYFLLTFRHIYTIGKKLYLSWLKFVNYKEGVCL